MKCSRKGLKMYFFEKYRPVFEVVARLLGNGWGINLLSDCHYQIKLTSPAYKNFNIIIRQDGQRLNIWGGVSSRYWRGTGVRCTVALNRKPDAIAAEITRKILPVAPEEIEKAQAAEKGHREEVEKIQILKGMLARLVHLENWYNTLTGFKVNNGLSGSVKEKGGSYQLKIEGLNTDQLIKLVGIVSQLEK